MASIFLLQFSSKKHFKLNIVIMGDSPEERRSKDVVPETAAKEAETGKGKKEKKEKSAEGTKPVSWADKWRIIWLVLLIQQSQTPRIATATGRQVIWQGMT